MWTVLHALRAVLQHTSQAGYAALIAAMEGRIVEEAPYILGEGAVYTLGCEQAVRLQCARNDVGLRQIIACFTEELDGLATVYILAQTQDGLWSGGGSTLPEMIGALRQPGSAPCLIAAQWTPGDNGGQIECTLRAIPKSEDIQEAYKHYLLESRGAMSLELRDLGALFGPGGAPTLPLTPLEKVTGFVRLWSAVKYNFAGFDQLPEVDWEAELEAYLPRVQNEESTEGYYRLLQQCLARLHDGQTAVWPGRATAANIVDAPPMLVRPCQGKAIIAALGKSEALQRQGLEAGSVITHVDSQPVEQLLEQDIYPYISASTPQSLDVKAYARLLEGPRGTPVRLLLETPSGNNRSAALTRHADWEAMPWRRIPAVQTRFQGSVLVLTLNSLSVKEAVERFDAALPRLLESEALIIDLRRNTGGSTYNGYAIIARLIDGPVQGSRWRTRQHLPAFRAWGQREHWYEGDHGVIRPRAGGRFSGPVALLTGPETAGAAEDFVAVLQTARRGIVIGEPTAGETGQPLMIDLPGGGSARICTTRDLFPDGREFTYVGIAPDVPVAPAIADYTEGRDPVLQTALDIIGEQG